MNDFLARSYVIDSMSGEFECNKNSSGPVHAIFCGNLTDINATDSVDCEYFRDNDVVDKPGIPGLGSSVFMSECIFVSF